MAEAWQKFIRQLGRLGLTDPLSPEGQAVLMTLDENELAPKGDANDPDWLEKFLAREPSSREAYEKGTAYFTMGRNGWISCHYTPDYYLDLIEKPK